MIKRAFAYLGMIVFILFAVALVAWWSSPDPKLNLASFEDSPLVENIAPLSEAITLAQFTGSDGKIVTMQVLDFSEETVTGIDLSEMGTSPSDDPFEVLASLNVSPLNIETAEIFPKINVSMSDLLPSGTTGSQHIGTGTNFPEHAEEAGSPSVFNFPKFGLATPARTQVRASPGVLLDYEVEFCVRFDRDIVKISDFDAAVKGLFLCGDFTNRNALVELADPGNLDSGTGFSDAKSGLDFFPTGPFLVIPNNWSSFLSKLRMSTSVNDQPRQDARANEMTLNFRQLVEKTLKDTHKRRFLYKGDYHYLAKSNRIDRKTTLMSGTAEGVIFTPPTRGDYIEGVARYLGAGGPFSENNMVDTVKQSFIQSELESGHFLQPGDLVSHNSTYLGDMKINVVK